MSTIKRIEDFELFKATEIKVREGAGYMSNGKKKKTLLLYQDARAAMNRLDKRFGEYGWQREHKDVHGVTYCGVSLWDEDKHCWVTKWDAGEPSNTAKQKGEASDSFKRACVNWGIGRELYTAPFIGVDESVNTNALKVTEIAYTADRKICALTIADRTGNVIYQFGKKNAVDAKKTAQASAEPIQLTEREQEEYDDAAAQMDAAPSYNDLLAIFSRYRDARFAKLLQVHGAKIKQEKGWQ